MKDMITKFPAQMMEALQIGENIDTNLVPADIKYIYVAGMGGSGIGANFVSSFIRKEARIPFIIGKDYEIPAFLDKSCLFIASSYSGSTEETLFALNQAVNQGCQIACISAGGKLLEMAKLNNWTYIQLPSGWSSPRACLGYSMIAQLSLLVKLGIVSELLLKQVKTASDLINFDQDEIIHKAQKIAQIIEGKLPIIYSTSAFEPVAVRWRQQLNENAKILCWHHVFPEMNHNELVGWKQVQANTAVIMLRNKDDYRRTAVRMDITKDILMKKSDAVIEIYSKGQSEIEKAIYFVHLGDWVSYHLSQSNGADPIEIEVIDYLKKELGKL